MLEIVGIDSDKVHRYGKKFLELVRASQRRYESMMYEQEDRPQDPNHQNVIDISSDEDVYRRIGGGDFDEQEASQEERSAYFEASADVRAFNAQRTFQIS